MAPLLLTPPHPMTFLVPRTPRTPDRGLGPTQDWRPSYQLVWSNLEPCLSRAITRSAIYVWGEVGGISVIWQGICMYEQSEKLPACKVIFGECDGNLRRHWHHSPHMKSLQLSDDLPKWVLGPREASMWSASVITQNECGTWTGIAWQQATHRV